MFNFYVTVCVLHLQTVPAILWFGGIFLLTVFGQNWFLQHGCLSQHMFYILAYLKIHVCLPPITRSSMNMHSFANVNLNCSSNCCK